MFLVCSIYTNWSTLHNRGRRKKSSNKMSSGKLKQFYSFSSSSCYVKDFRDSTIFYSLCIEDVFWHTKILIILFVPTNLSKFWLLNIFFFSSSPLFYLFRCFTVLLLTQYTLLPVIYTRKESHTRNQLW